jgi:hypothetical protein
VPALQGRDEGRGWIAPVQNDPGLIAYECLSCGYVTSVLIGSQRRRIRLPAMLPPVLQRSFRDAVTISKLPLRNMQTLADQLNI